MIAAKIEGQFFSIAWICQRFGRFHLEECSFIVLSNSLEDARQLTNVFYIHSDQRFVICRRASLVEGHDIQLAAGRTAGWQA